MLKPGQRIRFKRGDWGISLHRKEQYDLGVIPWLCCHVDTPNQNTRLFCVSSKGVDFVRWRWVKGWVRDIRAALTDTTPKGPSDE